MIISVGVVWERLTVNGVGVTRENKYTLKPLLINTPATSCPNLHIESIPK